VVCTSGCVLLSHRGRVRGERRGEIPKWLPVQSTKVRSSNCKKTLVAGVAPGDGLFYVEPIRSGELVQKYKFRRSFFSVCSLFLSRCFCPSVFAMNHPLSATHLSFCAGPESATYVPQIIPWDIGWQILDWHSVVVCLPCKRNVCMSGLWHRPPPLLLSLTPRAIPTLLLQGCHCYAVSLRSCQPQLQGQSLPRLGIPLWKNKHNTFPCSCSLAQMDGMLAENRVLVVYMIDDPMPPVGYSTISYKARLWALGVPRTMHTIVYTHSCLHWCGHPLHVPDGNQTAV